MAVIAANAPVYVGVDSVCADAAEKSERIDAAARADILCDGTIVMFDDRVATFEMRRGAGIQLFEEGAPCQA